MTNHRRRMQTRNRRIGHDVPYGNWPEVHNMRVAICKQISRHRVPRPQERPNQEGTQP